MKEVGNRVAILSGATATGKTALSISLAKKYGWEIVNFDSLLFYRELNIGTAKPSPEEMVGVPHHLVDLQSAKHPINAAQFSRLARDKIASLQQKKIIPLLVGGSGFYLKALLEGMDDKHPPTQEALDKSHDLYQTEGIEPFREILKRYDPVNFQKLYPNDHYRIRRAVEYYWSTGWAFSSAPQESKKAQSPPWDIFHLYLSIEKFQHWKIIQRRAEKMVAHGLVDEVSDLLSRGFTGDERPLRAIGYKEALDYLNGTIASKDQLIEMISTGTRQLAKAQKTFFAPMGPKRQWDSREDASEIHNAISQWLND